MTKEEKIKIIKECLINLEICQIKLGHIDDIQECVLGLNVLLKDFKKKKWIKIESEEDLPKDFCDVWVKDSLGNIEMTEYNSDYRSFSGYFSERNCGKVTHYQPIQKPEPPLY